MTGEYTPLSFSNTDSVISNIVRGNYKECVGKILIGLDLYFLRQIGGLPTFPGKIVFAQVLFV